MRIAKQRSMIDPLYVTIIVLLASVTAGLTQECTSSLDGKLIIADEQAIWKLDANGEHREALLTVPDAINLDYNYDKSSLYYSDLRKRQIFELKDGSTKPGLAIASQENWLPFGFALERISGKIYVADSFSGTVRVFDQQSDNQAVVVGANLTDVKDVEVDANEGYLFVLDRYQILRTELDGSNPNVIYYENGNIDDLLGELPGGFQTIIKSGRDPHELNKSYRKDLSIADLVLDTQAKRLYWVDTQKRIIESSDYEGKNRKIQFQDKKQSAGVPESLASLAYLDGSVYWADDVTEKVYKVDLNKENESQVILKNIQPRAIRAVSCKSQRQAVNPCAAKQCQQLCLLSKSSEGNSKCACSVGYEFDRDAKSCVKVQDLLLFVRNGFVRGQSLRNDGNNTSDGISPSRFQVGSDAILDVNAKNGVIFYNGIYPNVQIHQIRLSDGVTSLLQPDFLSSDVRYLAFDWVTGNLYYFTYYYADVTTLSVLNVNNPTYSKILIDSVQRLIRDIVVHPNRGYIYFAQLIDKRGFISRLATDGSDLKELIQLENSTSVEGMAVDYDEDRIYWSESTPTKSYRIRNSNLNGTDIKELPIPNNLRKPSALAIYGESIYVLGNLDRTLYRLDKRTGKGAVIVETEFPSSLSGLRLLSRSVQSIRSDHPCINNSCQKFCFAVPETDGDGLTAVCGCPYGEKLSEDGRSCVDNREAEPPFLPCRSHSFKCKMSKATT